MKFRTMLGLAAIGGLLYWHRRRGGEWTLDSFKDSARQLVKALQDSGDRAKREAREALEEASRQADRIAGNAGVRH